MTSDGNAPCPEVAVAPSASRLTVDTATKSITRTKCDTEVLSLTDAHTNTGMATIVLSGINTPNTTADDAREFLMKSSNCNLQSYQVYDVQTFIYMYKKFNRSLFCPHLLEQLTTKGHLSYMNLNGNVTRFFVEF